ncbi:MAG: adenosylmethionine--8-amino-7-oxononanoate transaminase [Planctomycetes bacterium]|nr:adenosylmethionine--8-amino-7-oxononanoate transaminase [Planctomycetota bacterium]
MINDLHLRDRKHLWHPYTEITAFEGAQFPIIERADGVYLYEVGGRKLLDGISSWWCVNLGHNHPRLVGAIWEQAAKLQHSILGGMSHPSAIRLAEQLAEIAPGELTHVYYAGDGSSATEAALKIAIQYWKNLDVAGRTRFISLEDGYHGDTLGAVGVGYVEQFHKDFTELLPPATRAPSPHCADCPCGKVAGECEVDCFTGMEELIRKYHRVTAAIIVEPLCQGAAGIRIYPEEYLRRLRRLCDEFDLLLIADEIAVGFGRTGKMFACERAGLVPDMMTIGKGLTGGYLPMSAVMLTDKIYNTFRRDGERIRTFYHGHTFCGNPITSELASAAISVYQDEDIINNSQPRSKQLEAALRRLAEPLQNSTVLTLGMIGVIELSPADGGSARATRIAAKALEAGLFIRPLGPAVYLWPPLTITESELDDMLAILKDAFIATA